MPAFLLELNALDSGLPTGMYCLPTVSCVTGCQIVMMQCGLELITNASIPVRALVFGRTGVLDFCSLNEVHFSDRHGDLSFPESKSLSTVFVTNMFLQVRQKV